MTGLLRSVVRCNEIRARGKRLQFLVTVLEEHLSVNVFVFAGDRGSSINATRRIVSGGSFPGLHLDRGGDKTTGISNSLRRLPTVFVNIRRVVLLLQFNERQTLALSIDNHTKTIRDRSITHVHRVRASRQTLLLQRTGQNLKPLTGLLVLQVHVAIVGVLILIRIVEVLVTEQTEINLAGLRFFLFFRCFRRLRIRSCRGVSFRGLRVFRRFRGGPGRSFGSFRRLGLF